MMKIARIALLLLAVAFPAYGQGVPQLGAGQVLGNTTAARAPGQASSVTGILDRALGSTRGAIIERGASGWAIIGPGTAGLPFLSGGAGADPAYGILGLSGGGCNTALTASAGGILWTDATKCNVLAGTATAGQMLRSGSSAAPSWSTAVWPSTVAQGDLLYASALNTVAALTKSASATRYLSNTGASNAPAWAQVDLTNGVTGTLPYANGGCNATTQAGCTNNIFPTPTRAGDIAYWNGTAWVTLPGNNSGTQVLQENSSGVPSWATISGTGTVTSVGWVGGIVSVATATTTPAFTIAGTSGGIPYFSSASTWASSGALTQNALVLGGGAGAAPTPLGSLGTTSTVLHGNAAGAPTFGAVAYTDIASGDLASNANYLAGTASKLVNSGVIYQGEVTVTFGATTTFDFSLFNNAVVTLTGNITTQTLSNVTAGKSGSITFIQDATGSRTTVWNSIFKFAGGTTPSLTTTASAIDMLNYHCRTTTFCEASLNKDVK